MAEKENFKFEEEITRDKKAFVHAYDNDSWYIPVNAQLTAYHLWIENRNDSNYQAIKGFVKSDTVFSTTNFPFMHEFPEYFAIEIFKRNVHVDNHALLGIKENLKPLRSEKNLMIDIKDNFKNNGTCMHFWDDTSGLNFNFYLSEKIYNNLIDALTKNIIQQVTFNIFFPNLYKLKQIKHPYEHHYRFFDDEFNKGLITNINIATNTSNKDSLKEIYGTTAWLESYQRIHPITRKIENVYFQFWVFDIVKSFLHLFFGWAEQRDDIKAIRHLLTVIAFLLFFIYIYLINSDKF